MYSSKRIQLSAALLVCLALHVHCMPSAGGMESEVAKKPEKKKSIFGQIVNRINNIMVQHGSGGSPIIKLVPKETTDFAGLPSAVKTSDSRNPETIKITLTTEKMGPSNVYYGLTREKSAAKSVAAPVAYAAVAFAAPVSDVNQCETGQHKCGKFDYCFNRDDTAGDHDEHPESKDHSAESHLYACYSYCPAPYYKVVKGESICVDVDECALGLHKCGETYACVNLDGGYNCKRTSCTKGLKMNAQGECVDKNECTEDPNICGTGGTCLNNYGAYYCQCNRGYRWNIAIKKCEDVDECFEIPNACQSNPNYKCVNSAGGYDCKRFRCNQGFKLQPDGNCADLDECAENPQICGEGGTCTNRHGSYFCYCKSGYKWNSAKKSCEDYNECETENGYCSHECANTKGSFKCSCPTGYSLHPNGRWCNDINECQQNPCGPRDHCVNTYGAHHCIPTACPSPSYVRRGQKCSKKRCEAGDEVCPTIVEQSYSWGAYPFHKTMKQRSFTFTYRMAGWSHEFTKKFELVQGNADGSFEIVRQRQGREDLAIIRNVKEITGPKTIRLVMNADVINGKGVLSFRYVYTFYLDLGKYDF